ncbi:MAG: choice-of-anchor L domain-containing protein [Lishizhenia sp.]
MKHLFVIFLLFSFGVSAQLVTSNMTPGNLVQNVLAGTGVTISNVNYTGSSQSLGYFDGSNTNIGLDEGVILTTGTINNNGNGPHGPNNSAGSGVDLNGAGYNRLNNLLDGGSTFDATILEFDFVPFSDTVKFNYVFASEEYPEFVGSDFNDIFAFFISGPGIVGEKNMAIVPGTNAAVAINNVNNGPANIGPCTNCPSYINNGDGNSAPYNSSNFYVQYDGFTIPLQAISDVQCGETYHLIMAVADVGDGQWDSGIFLEGGSLTSETPVTVSYELSQLAFNQPNVMAEGCVDATVTVTRTGPDIVNPLNIPINVSGSAIEGVDYSNVPASVTFAANQTTQSFTISAFQDGVAEGQESIVLDFQILDPCQNLSVQTVNLLINDLEDVEVVVDDVEVVCPGDLVQLTASATGGGGTYTYLWSNGATTESIIVSPTTTTTYTVQATDDCLNQTATGTGQVVVPVYDPLDILVTDPIVEQCPFVPFTLTAELSGGAGGYQYEWFDDQGSGFLGFSESIEVAPNTTTQYSVIVTDQCDNVVIGVTSITILSPPLTLEVPDFPVVCPDTEVELSVSAQGGFGNYYYFWPHSGETTQNVFVSPLSTTTYEVVVSDDCQTFTVSAFNTIEVVQPNANFIISSQTLYEDLPITFQNLTTGAVSYVWDFGQGSGSSDVHPNHVYDEPGTYQVQLIATNEIGCIDSITKPIVILPEFYLYIPNTFTPDGNRFNTYFEVSAINVVEFEIKIFNRWGENIFESKDVDFQWDGFDENGLPVPDGTYVWKIFYRSINDDEETITGHVNVLR